jgi:voltage-gated sodium channel
VIELARRIADNPRFQHFFLAVIILGAIVIGVETSPVLAARHGGSIGALEMLIQTIFVAEIAIRLLAYWPRPAAFFRNGWNVFDFVVVTASLLPQAGAFAMVARLARLLRITRVVSAFPSPRRHRDRAATPRRAGGTPSCAAAAEVTRLIPAATLPASSRAVQLESPLL